MKAYKAKAGSLIRIERGECSDYAVDGFFVVLKEFIPCEVLEQYLLERPDQTAKYKFNENEFLFHMISIGLLLEIEHGVLYLSDYGHANNVRFTPWREEE